MAYAVASPPAMLTQRVGGGGAFWLYNSADAATAVRVTGYITDGQDLGMAVGDLVFQTDLAGGTVGHIYIVKSLHATNGSVDLTDGTAIVATDTD